MDEKGIEKIKEAMKMTDLYEMLVGEAVNEAVNEALNKKEVDMAKKMLKRGLSVDAVAEDTGLDESTVIKIKEEFEKAVV
jgi:predicted transcriptional regulator